VGSLGLQHDRARIAGGRSAIARIAWLHAGSKYGNRLDHVSAASLCNIYSAAWLGQLLGQRRLRRCQAEGPIWIANKLGAWTAGTCVADGNISFSLSFPTPQLVSNVHQSRCIPCTLLRGRFDIISERLSTTRSARSRGKGLARLPITALEPPSPQRLEKPTSPITVPQAVMGLHRHQNSSAIPIHRSPIRIQRPCCALDPDPL
jgi:hypothetical protein